MPLNPKVKRRRLYLLSVVLSVCTQAANADQRDTNGDGIVREKDAAQIAQVAGVDHAILVEIGVAHIAMAVPIAVALIGVDEENAVAEFVRNADR